MEFYRLRKGGKDTDFIIEEEDYNNLLQKYKTAEGKYFGDYVLTIGQYEFWRSIRFYDYNFYLQDASEQADFLVISLKSLVFMKALCIKDEERHLEDLRIIVEKVLQINHMKYLRNRLEKNGSE